MKPLNARRLVREVDRLGRHLRLLGEEAWIRDLGWRFLDANTPFASRLGTPPNDLEGRVDLDFFDAEVCLGFRRDDLDCVAGGRPVSYFEHSAPDEVAHETLKLPLEVGGEVVGVLGIACPTRGPNGAGSPPAWLRLVRHRIARRFTVGVKIDELARRAAVHPDHLGRSFKRHYGLGVHDFVRRLRVQWCSWALLTDPGRPLSDLATAAGFADQSHLTREFARIRGTTPGRYREHWGQAADGGADGSCRLSCLAPPEARERSR